MFYDGILVTPTYSSVGRKVYAASTVYRASRQFLQVALCLTFFEQRRVHDEAFEEVPRSQHEDPTNCLLFGGGGHPASKLFP